METIDLGRQLRGIYSATAKLKVLDVGEGSFLSTDGQGSPGGDAFQAAIGQIFGVAYTLKFALKAAGTLDFKVSKLEMLYPDDPSHVPDTSLWHWSVMIRIPEQVTEAQVAEVKAQMKEKKGIDASSVSLIRMNEERCVQKMHVGPYEQVGNTYHEIGTEAASLGLELKGPGHEIYISDPRRTPPERLKTIVRLGVVD